MKVLFNTIVYFFRKDRKFYFKLLHILGFLPGDIAVYRQAFIPRSASSITESGDPLNNERLEFLGDALLGAIVADYLFLRYPGKDEGFMTKLRSRIVKRKHLNALGEKIGLPSLMHMPEKHLPPSKHVYGNAFEALLGAIYLDKGYLRTRRFFIKKVLLRYIDLRKMEEKDPDYKSQIIEWAQKNREEIAFETIAEQKHSGLLPSFVSRVKLNDLDLGTGMAGSKKEAEQDAARKALQHLKHN